MRRFAAMGLQGIGREAAAAEKALHDALSDTDVGARIAAAGLFGRSPARRKKPCALAEIGPEAKAAVPELVACLKSARALWRINRCPCRRIRWKMRKTT